MSITVVSLNPSIDVQLSVAGFVYGGLNRVREVGRYASGKGINVCAALANLGQPPVCIGFNYCDNGYLITDALDEWGVGHDFVDVAGVVRTNIKLYDSMGGAMTELNQPGAYVPEEALLQLINKINASSGSTLILSGSMPAGVPADFYRQLCQTTWPGCVILDAEGEALKLALSGDKPPFCIKPNLYELETCFGVRLSAKEDIAAFCQDLIKTYGIRMICVSMGADGAMLVTDSSAYYVPALDLAVKGVQGAGDAMVAGLAYGLSQGMCVPGGIQDVAAVSPMAEAKLLQMASAAAAASVIREGTLMCIKTDFEKYLAMMPEPCTIDTNLRKSRR